MRHHVSRRRPIFLRLSGLLLASSMAANAFADEQPRIEYYPIEGSSASQLQFAMAARGPAGDDGRRFHGYTRWFVRWKYNTTRQGKSCQVTSVDVQTSGTITLPQWTNEGAARPALRERWQRYIAALRRHEEGHYRFAVEAAAQIRESLSGMKSGLGCGDLQQRANARGQAILEAQRRSERAYDQATGHGRTQGVTL